jgi:hypothetical protein
MVNKSAKSRHKNALYGCYTPVVAVPVLARMSAPTNLRAGLPAFLWLRSPADIVLKQLYRL